MQIYLFFAQVPKRTSRKPRNPVWSLASVTTELTYCLPRYYGPYSQLRSSLLINSFAAASILQRVQALTEYLFCDEYVCLYIYPPGSAHTLTQPLSTLCSTFGFTEPTPFPIPTLPPQTHTPPPKNQRYNSCILLYTQVCYTTPVVASLESTDKDVHTSLLCGPVSQESFSAALVIGTRRQHC